MERLVFDLVSFGPWLSHVLSSGILCYKGSDFIRFSTFGPNRTVHNRDVYLL